MKENNSENWKTVDKCIMNVLTELSESTNNSIGFRDIVTHVKKSYNGNLSEKDIHSVLVRMKRGRLLQFHKRRVIVMKKMTYYLNH